VHLGSYLYRIDFDSVCEYWLLGSLVESSVEHIAESILWSHSLVGAYLTPPRSKLPGVISAGPSASPLSRSVCGMYLTLAEFGALARHIQPALEPPFRRRAASVAWGRVVSANSSSVVRRDDRD